MVFKVKQKAESDYFSKKRLDKYPDGHPEKVLSVENDIFKYGFNWPYDYFSLVELVNLKSKITFEQIKASRIFIDDEKKRLLEGRGDEIE